MAITLSELVDVSHLKLTVLAGRAGLARPVTWAHVSEVASPADWLEGGELLCTAGFGLPRDDADQVEYLRKLAERGAAGLCVGHEPGTPQVSREMLDTGESLGFPIIEIADEVPFIEIERIVYGASKEESQRKFVVQLRVVETMRAATSEGLSVTEIFARLRRASDCDLFLCNRWGGPLLEDVPVPPAEIIEQIVNPAPTVGNRSPTIAHGHIVPVVLSGKEVGHIVALRKDGKSAGLAAIQHIATIAAVEVSNLRREREILRREGAETLVMLLNGELHPHDADRRLTASGFPPTQKVVLLALRTGPESANDNDIHHHMCDHGIPHLLLERDFVLLVLSDDEHALETLQQMAGKSRIGVSRPCVGVELGVAHREALWAIERAIDRDEQLVHFSQEETAASWLPPDRTVLDTIVTRILGPVLEYDAQHNSSLLLSLQALFTHDRRLDAAARELNVHKHTLSYRMRTVERLTGRKLARLRDLVDLWLALKAHELLAVTPGRPRVRAREAARPEPDRTSR